MRIPIVTIEIRPLSWWLTPVYTGHAKRLRWLCLDIQVVGDVVVF